jgi:RHS repeat-associated protein
VDVATGRVFTLPCTVLELPGALPLVIERQYSSSASLRDVGLGFGWTHTLAWRIKTTRRVIQVWTDEGVSVDFPLIREGEEILGSWGWILHRRSTGYVLDKNDGLKWIFDGPVGEDSEWRLSGVEDRCGNKISLAYEGGRLSEVRDSVGRRVRFTRGPRGCIGAVEVLNAASQGKWVAFETYEYDVGGRLISATDAEGYARSYAYDERNLLVRHTDRVGLSFHYVYDALGRCVETWGDWMGRPEPSLAEALPEFLADGATRAKGIYHRKIDYMPNGYREVATSRQVRRFFVNRHGLADKVVDGGHVTRASYDDAGHMLSETNELDATTLYARDARGRLLAQTDPLGRVVRYERDGLGEIVKVVDPAGLATEITRDVRGLPIATKDPSGALRRFVYDDRGLLTETHDATGGVARMDYDAAANLTRVVDTHGGIWLHTYDSFGRLISLTDPSGAVTRYQYSARGELTAETDPTGATTRWVHDGEERVVEFIDAAGRVHHRTWTGFHWLHQLTDATGRVARARFGRDGELLEVENGRGERHRFVYNAAYLPVEERFFDGRVVRYRYDPAGQQTRVHPMGGEPIDYRYDLAGQVESREAGDRREEFVYDVRGFLERVTGPDGFVAFTRDAMGRIVREIQATPDGSTFTIDTQYDAEGRPIGRHTSLGHTLSSELSPDGRASRILLDGRHAIVRHHDALGREIARVLPGGIEVHSQFDLAGRLTRRHARRALSGRADTAGHPEWVADRPPGVLVDTAYSYEASGRLEAVHDMARGHVSYRRDSAGRLLERIVNGGRSESFAFDATGNLLDAGPNAPAREHGQGDKLLRRGDVTYHYDALGRLSEKREGAGDPRAARVTHYAWDGRGLLRSARTPDGRLVEFFYDAFARRVEKRVSQVLGGDKRLLARTRFFWDRHVPVHEVQVRIDDPVVEERTYVFEGRSAHPMAHREARKVRDDVQARWVHYVNDPLGTPERLLDERGEIAGEVRLSVWGEAVSTGAVATPIRFLGQYADEETGLVYNRHRYYDPEIGRFISPDPIGLAGGLNSFARGSDPSAEFDVYGQAVETYYPAPLTHKQRLQLRMAARAAYRKDADLVKQGDVGIKKNDSKCLQVAEKVRDQNRDKGVRVVGISTPDESPLRTRENGKNKLWDNHHVNEDANGRIIDHDQQMVFDPPNARQKHANSLFGNPAVTYQTVFF